MRDITLWYKYSPKDHSYKFNHLEWGHSKDPKPKPVVKNSQAQKDWGNSRWLKDLSRISSTMEVFYES